MRSIFSATLPRKTASDYRLRFSDLNSEACRAIIPLMRAKPHHPWNVTPTDARAIQEKLRSQVLQKNAASLRRIQHVAGVDISIRNDRAIAAIVVLDFETLQVVDFATHEDAIPFPYVPGLLSFRECPSILAAAEKLRVEPDLVLVDGQGIAHPRRLGIAAHLGVLLDKPTIGCAKSRLTGKHEEPSLAAGSHADLCDRDELIGVVLRTKNKVRPLYISIGHKVELPTAIELVLACCRGYRLPEPTRFAHQVAGGKVLSLPVRN
jgi:deoxyribonuclease V